MKGANIRAQAKKEIALEKDRILRKKGETPSLLEKAALAWKKTKEADEREKQKENFQREAEGSFNYQELLSQQIVQYDKQKLFKETDWSQYKPWQKKEGEKEKVSLNTATVRAMAKKLIAREWRRALGKPQSSEFDSLERTASSWKKRKDEEKRKKEEMKQKMSRQKKILKEALYQFGQKLRQEKDTIKPEEAAALIEETLESVGEIFDIEWHKQGCYIWLESWEEKKTRRISGDTLPVVYRAKIDQNLNIASFQIVDKEETRLKMRQELLFKPLQGLLIDDEKEAEEVLEGILSNMGRIINLKRTNKGWTAAVEPWERLRVRNIKNKGKCPVKGIKIEVNWSEGKFSFLPK